MNKAQIKKSLKNPWVQSGLFIGVVLLFQAPIRRALRVMGGSPAYTTLELEMQKWPPGYNPPPGYFGHDPKKPVSIGTAPVQSYVQGCPPGSTPVTLYDGTKICAGKL